MSTLSSDNLDANYNYIDERTSEHGNFFVDPAYGAYRDRIERLIRDAADFAAEGFRGLCIRQIHMALGDDARPSWTLDALASLSGIAEVQSGGMRRWLPLSAVTQQEQQPIKRDPNPEHLFAGPAQQERKAGFAAAKS